MDEKQAAPASPIADVVEVKHFLETLGKSALKAAEGSHTYLSLFLAMEPAVAEIPTVIKALHMAKAELPLVPKYFDDLVVGLPAELGVTDPKSVAVINGVVGMLKHALEIAIAVGMVHPVAE